MRRPVFRLRDSLMWMFWIYGRSCRKTDRISQYIFRTDFISLIKAISLWQSIYGHFLRGEWLICPSFCHTGGTWTQNALRAAYCVIKTQVRWCTACKTPFSSCSLYLDTLILNCVTKHIHQSRLDLKTGGVTQVKSQIILNVLPNIYLEANYFIELLIRTKLFSRDNNGFHFQIFWQYQMSFLSG